MRSICVLADLSPGYRHDYQRATYELGALLARYGCHLVYGGESVGSMRTVFNAVVDTGGSATGVISRQQAERSSHIEMRLSELHVTDDKHARTALMANLSDAVIIVPGGLEPLTAFAEVCTRYQQGHGTPAALLNTSGYFNGFVSLLDQAVDDGLLPISTRRMIIIERDPVVLLERLLPALATP